MINNTSCSSTHQKKNITIVSNEDDDSTSHHHNNDNQEQQQHRPYKMTIVTTTPNEEEQEQEETTLTYHLSLRGVAQLRAYHMIKLRTRSLSHRRFALSFLASPDEHSNIEAIEKVYNTQMNDQTRIKCDHFSNLVLEHYHQMHHDEKLKQVAQQEEAFELDLLHSSQNENNNNEETNNNDMPSWDSKILPSSQELDEYENNDDDNQNENETKKIHPANIIFAKFFYNEKLNNFEEAVRRAELQVTNEEQEKQKTETSLLPDNNMTEEILASAASHTINHEYGTKFVSALNKQRSHIIGGPRQIITNHPYSRHRPQTTRLEWHIPAATARNKFKKDFKSSFTNKNNEIDETNDSAITNLLSKRDLTLLPRVGFWKKECFQRLQKCKGMFHECRRILNALQKKQQRKKDEEEEMKKKSEEDDEDDENEAEEEETQRFQQQQNQQNEKMIEAMSSCLVNDPRRTFGENTVSWFSEILGTFRTQINQTQSRTNNNDFNQQQQQNFVCSAPSSHAPTRPALLHASSSLPSTPVTNCENNNVQQQQNGNNNNKNLPLFEESASSSSLSGSLYHHQHYNNTRTTSSTPSSPTSNNNYSSYSNNNNRSTNNFDVTHIYGRTYTRYGTSNNNNHTSSSSLPISPTANNMPMSNRSSPSYYATTSPCNVSLVHQNPNFNNQPHEEEGTHHHRPPIHIISTAAPSQQNIPDCKINNNNNDYLNDADVLLPQDDDENENENKQTPPTPTLMLTNNNSSSSSSTFSASSSAPSTITTATVEAKIELRNNFVETLHQTQLKMFVRTEGNELTQLQADSSWESSNKNLNRIKNNISNNFCNPLPPHAQRSTLQSYYATTPELNCFHLQHMISFFGNLKNVSVHYNHEKVSRVKQLETMIQMQNLQQNNTNQNTIIRATNCSFRANTKIVVRVQCRYHHVDCVYYTSPHMLSSDHKNNKHNKNILTLPFSVGSYVKFSGDYGINAGQVSSIHDPLRCTCTACFNPSNSLVPAPRSCSSSTPTNNNNRFKRNTHHFKNVADEENKNNNNVAKPTVILLRTTTTTNSQQQHSDENDDDVENYPEQHAPLSPNDPRFPPGRNPGIFGVVNDESELELLTKTIPEVLEVQALKIIREFAQERGADLHLKNMITQNGTNNNGHNRSSSSMLSSPPISNEFVHSRGYVCLEHEKAASSIYDNNSLADGNSSSSSYNNSSSCTTSTNLSSAYELSELRKSNILKDAAAFPNSFSETDILYNTFTDLNKIADRVNKVEGFQPNPGYYDTCPYSALLVPRVHPSTSAPYVYLFATGNRARYTDSLFTVEPTPDPNFNTNRTFHHHDGFSYSREGHIQRVVKQAEYDIKTTLDACFRLLHPYTGKAGPLAAQSRDFLRGETAKNYAHTMIKDEFLADWALAIVDWDKVNIEFQFDLKSCVIFFEHDHFVHFGGLARKLCQLLMIDHVWFVNVRSNTNTNNETKTLPLYFNPLWTGVCMEKNSNNTNEDDYGENSSNHKNSSIAYYLPVVVDFISNGKDFTSSHQSNCFASSGSKSTLFVDGTISSSPPPPFSDTPVLPPSPKSKSNFYDNNINITNDKNNENDESLLLDDDTTNNKIPISITDFVMSSNQFQLLENFQRKLLCLEVFTRYELDERSRLLNDESGRFKQFMNDFNNMCELMKRKWMMKVMKNLNHDEESKKMMKQQDTHAPSITTAILRPPVIYSSSSASSSRQNQHQQNNFSINTRSHQKPPPPQYHEKHQNTSNSSDTSSFYSVHRNSVNNNIQSHSSKKNSSSETTSVPSSYHQNQNGRYNNKNKKAYY